MKNFTPTCPVEEVVPENLAFGELSEDINSPGEMPTPVLQLLQRWVMGLQNSLSVLLKVSLL